MLSFVNAMVQCYGVTPLFAQSRNGRISWIDDSACGQPSRAGRDSSQGIVLGGRFREGFGVRRVGVVGYGRQVRHGDRVIAAMVMFVSIVSPSHCLTVESMTPDTFVFPRGDHAIHHMNNRQLVRRKNLYPSQLRRCPNPRKTSKE